MSQPAGVSRVDQRIENDAEVAAVRKKAKDKERHADPYAQKKKKSPLQVVNIAILEKQNDMILKQLTLYSQNKDVYVCMFTQDVYDQKVDKLLEKLPNPVADMMRDNEEGGGNSDSDSDEAASNLFK